MNIKKFLYPHEDCIKMVKDGINQYTKKEMYALMNNHGLSSSISKTVRHRFCSSNIDEYGNVYLYDELSPKKITDYFIEIGYPISKDIIYAYVCQVLMCEINAFYQRLDTYKKDTKIIYSISDNNGKVNVKKYIKLYSKAMNERISTGYKRIRRKSF